MGSERALAGSKGQKDATQPDPSAIPTPDQTPLYHALEQPRYSRQGQIRDIEKRTGRRLIALIGGTSTSISAGDVRPFMDLLDDVESGSDLDLMLQTPGGDVDQAERIVLLCRKRVRPKGIFRVVVPDSAKSAGTLIALASDKIVMGEPSELGPIDPQVFITTANGESMYRPAHSFLDGLQAIADEVKENQGKLSPAYFPLLDKLDPALIDFCNKAISRSEKFAKDFLSKYMLKSDPKKAEEIAEKLNSAKAYLSHGAVIDAEAALELGLDVESLGADNDLWRAYWRLYCEMRVALEKPTWRLVEGRRASMVY